MERDNRTILYSKIGLLSLPIIIWYLWNGWTVRYFTLHPIADTILRFLSFPPEILERIENDDALFFDRIDLQNAVLDTVEQDKPVYPSWTRIQSNLNELFGSPDIVLSYKKVAANDLHSALYRRWMAEKVVPETDGSVEYLLVPELSDAILRYYPDALERAGMRLPIWRSPFWVPCILYVYGLGDMVRSLFFILIFPFWTFARIGLPSINKEVREEFCTAFRIYREDLGFHYSHRSIDFLIDGERLTAKNCIFCIDDDIGTAYENELKNRGYRSVHLGKILHHADIRFVTNTIIKKVLPAWVSIFCGFWRQPWSVNRLTLELLNTFLLWEKFFENYSIRHYVAYNDTVPAHVGRNLLFSKRDVQSWYYVHSVHSYDVFTPRDRRMFREIEFSFLNFTHIVVWGDNVERYYRACPNMISTYDNTGCLWSQHALDVRNMIQNGSLAAGMVEPVPQQPHAKSLKKTIGIFDTSFGGGAPLNDKDMILFIKAMLALADDFPYARFVYKNKYLMQTVSSYRPALVPYFNEIRRHPSFYLCDESYRDPADIIAVSNLVISLAFTSPSIEALGARTRALYFDPAGRFRNTYYDRFPNLVAHDYACLKDLVRHWLEETNDTEFEHYLDTHVRGELDAHIDGRAINRFRNLLYQTCEGP